MLRSKILFAPVPPPAAPRPFAVASPGPPRSILPSQLGDKLVPSAYQFRVHLVVPEARFPAFGQWYQQALDAADDGSGWPRVNASGRPDEAATHRETCTALTAAELVRLLDKLADGAVPNWGSMTRPEKIAWLRQARDALWADHGVAVSLSPNDGNWDDFPAHRLLRGLKPRQPERP